MSAHNLIRQVLVLSHF
uniref:Uncharacterized protein n=1 Tax=Anguilla anguilla TaxID=7936 RepID=A0A0E9P544_ANGAN